MASKSSKNFILFFLLLSGNVIAQLHTPQYFSQYTHGTGWSLSYTSIVVGDINMDSIPDVIYSQAEGYQLGYGKLTNGQITFDMQPIDYYRYGWWYYNGQLVDYDRDGDLDYLTASTYNFDFTRTFIMENVGGQLADTFKSSTPPYLDKSRLYFGRFNQDDVDDVLYNVSQPLMVKLQDGATGEFIDLPFNAYNTSFRDLNDDGLMDFIQGTANSPVYHTQTDILYLNRGDYTFDRVETPGYLSHPAGLEREPWGDFDGDGVDDEFAKPLGMVGLAFVFKSNMQYENAARFDTLVITATQDLETVFVRDMTGDGTEDLIVFSQDSLYFLESDEGMHFNISAWPSQLHPDLIVEHPDLPKGTLMAMTIHGLPLLLHISWSDSTGLMVKEDFNAFSPYVISHAIYASPTTHVDLDADGQNELCVSTEFTLACAELQTDQSLHEQIIRPAFDNYIGRSISSADWNGDGHVDLFLNEGNDIYVSLRQPDSTWSERQYLTTGYLLEAVDFDRNGYADLLTSDLSSVSIYYSDQGALVEQALILDHGGSPEHNILDPNKDGLPDVALGWDSTYFFLNRGDRIFSDVPVKVLGRLALSTLTNSEYVFTILSQTVEETLLYRPNLFRIDAEQQEAQWVAGYVVIDSVINNREAWLVNYDGDSVPDMLFNMLDVPTQEWKAILVNEQEAVYAIYNVHQSFLLGAEDVAEDGVAEVLYVKGSKAYLEIGIPQDITSTTTPSRSAPQLLIFPNPISSGDPWTLAYESDYIGPVQVDIFLPNGQCLRHYTREKSELQWSCTFDGIPNYQGSLLVRVSEGNGIVFKKLISLGQ